jgi:hypothetical protein
MRRLLAWWVLALCPGCSGYYVLTAPDAVGPAGGEATVIARLQRRELPMYWPGVKDAPLRFQVGDGIERSAYTDEEGYAGVPLAAPKDPRAYPMVVRLQDREGDEMAAEATFYSLAPDRPVAAVDLDSLPDRGAADASAACSAVRRAAREMNVLYMTRAAISGHRERHQWLASQGYPDGPILPWQHEWWRIERDPKFNVPKVVFERRLVSQLGQLRATFRLIRAGICRSDLAARSFRDASLPVVFIGAKVDQDIKNVTLRSSWAELAERGF